MVRERHEIRRTPISNLSHEAVVRFLDMGVDAEILVPVALDRLHFSPDSVVLVCGLLRTDNFDWRGQPQQVARLRGGVSMLISQVGQIDDDLERLQYEVAIWRLYAEFERTLSAV